MTDKTKVENPKTGSYIESCTCVNKYQDDVYGKGFRVHNRNKEGGTCTVCRRIKGEKK